MESLADMSHEWLTGSDSVPLLRVTETFGRKNTQCLFFRTVTIYSFHADCITVDAEVWPLKGVADLRSLARVGLQLLLSPTLSRLTWLGCGGESYPDRKAANDWRVHCGDADDQYQDYFVPGECGGKADVHWASLTDPSSPGVGLLLQYSSQDAPTAREVLGGLAGKRSAGTRGAQFNVSRYSTEELTATMHRDKLPRGDAVRSRPLRVNIDTAHMGVGAAGAGTDKVWAVAPQYYVKADAASPWNYKVVLRPLSGRKDWGHDGGIAS